MSIDVTPDFLAEQAAIYQGEGLDSISNITVRNSQNKADTKLRNRVTVELFIGYYI